MSTIPDYRLPKELGNSLQSNFQNSVKTTRKELMPGNTFALIIVQMIFFGFLISLSYKLFRLGGKPKTPWFQ